MGDLEAVLAEHGLMIGHDPYSVPIATIAGTISTNGVGYRACAHGPMGEQVVGLEAVLPDGRVIETRDIPKYSSGPNLNHLFIGAEGVFGVITRATVRIFRTPESSQFASVGFDCFDDGFNAAIRNAGCGYPTFAAGLDRRGRRRNAAPAVRGLHRRSGSPSAKS